MIAIFTLERRKMSPNLVFTWRIVKLKLKQLLQRLPLQPSAMMRLLEMGWVFPLSLCQIRKALEQILME